jgi:hypothetical protein
MQCVLAKRREDREAHRTLCGLATAVCRRKLITKRAIFRQVNQGSPHAHHDALEFPDGDMLLLTYLMEGQEAVVLQLPL